MTEPPKAPRPRGAPLGNQYARKPDKPSKPNLICKVPPDQKALWVKVSKVSGRFKSLTDFVIYACNLAANQIMQNENEQRTDENPEDDRPV